MITNYDDAGTYCCAPQYADNTKSCCYHVTGNHRANIAMHNMYCTIISLFLAIQYQLASYSCH